LVQAWISLDRLQSFLNLENLNWLQYYSFENVNLNKDDKIVDIRNGCFDWRKKDNEKRNEENNININETNELLVQTDQTLNYDINSLILKELNLKIRRGQLIGIIGKVGSGKTSLLHSLMAEIDKVDGEVRIDSSICANGFAYVSQESWIEAMSIKDNILFGSPMNEEIYKKVIEACALGTDLKLFPKGDETHVGENGICLSGGQKARLALSRACYAQDKEIYLLDDPLSAVDAHVAKHIYDNCINGILANKTRIISTHHIKYLSNADLVIVIDQSRIVDSGPGSQIIPKYLNVFKNKLDDEISNKSYISLDEAQQNEDTNSNILIRCSSVNTNNEIITETDKLDNDIKELDEEEKEHGVINFKVYKHYCKSVGYFLSIFTILTLTLMQLSRNITDFWLSYWTENSPNLNSTNDLYKDLFTYHKKYYLNKVYVLNPDKIHIYDPKSFVKKNTDFHFDSHTQGTFYFFMVYGILCIANTFFTLLRAFGFAFSGIMAGKRIHKRLIENISNVFIIY
jgi:ATP-binding cassette subfamily C (CFTR/MRP) protein 10